MNAVQDEHRKLISALASTGGQLWVADTGSDDRKEIDELWGEIVSGVKAFQFSANVHTLADFKTLKEEALARFKDDILAALARIMSRPKGRALLKELRAGATGGKNIVFMMPGLYKLIGGYVGANAQATNESNAKVRQDEGKIVPGPGSGSGVLVTPGVKDASMMDIDEKGNLIPSPAFVGVAHELIHAAHYQRGTYAKGAKVKLPQGYEGDIEEFAAIASSAESGQSSSATVTADLAAPSGGQEQQATFPLAEALALNQGLPTEADIRDEHGLGIRHGHESTANPFLHPATVGGNPGDFVHDAKEWLLQSWPIEEETPEHEQLEADQRKRAKPKPPPGFLAQIKSFFGASS